ncbi:putative BRCA1 C Terminus domain-containing protein [Colletotrichum sublineola]|uniref:Putative BRCA1 C Terminus domain-containing protein n=1 Tax=Colletotrichum sublineola TaxID=1173701 RepID=A0A066XXW9_COLSU|nr:putative BRCA1 C Terminus domain-containing protein [Colletotrichum sublineola]
MPSTERSSVPPAAKPRFGSNFDPYNSSATGHQRPDNNPGVTTGWRTSRARKLSEQFAGGNSGGARMSDNYSAGSEDFDEKLKMVVPKDVKARAKMSVADMLAQPGLMRSGPSVSEKRSATSTTSTLGGNPTSEEGILEAYGKEDEKEPKKATGRGLFEGVTVYVNGSTHPIISDHRLKRVLVENGGRRPAGVGAGAGAGGGLAGSKLDKEIRKVGGCTVKYVGVEWQGYGESKGGEPAARGAVRASQSCAGRPKERLWHVWEAL